ncbi:MAG: mechanosensitive ion channel [Desulfobulbaceae bacterium]|jgi:small conductance mechanosensitive channel|nr:mechanosensitive ion channel [Desulfobulbaceae bacterium]MDY0349992.1 mechanosensitive ion channel [Desulfobulbaceae bacterium]
METYAKVTKIAWDWITASGPSILYALIILLVGRWLAKWVTYLIQRALERTGMDATLVHFLEKLIYYTLLIAVALAAADQVGIKTTSFLAILGAAGLAVGLALKDSLANFASGVMLILFHPFKVGDAVTAAGISGTVVRIDIFNSVIHTWDNQKVIIPNSMITSDVITNINANPTRRIDLVIGIGYEDDPIQAKALLLQLVQEDRRILADPAPTVALAEFGDSSVNLVLRPWVRTAEYWAVRFDLLEKIKRTFDEHQITIPYPQRDVHLHHHDREK